MTPPDDFLPQRPFPTEAPPAPASPPRAAGRGAVSRYVLPGVLFVGIIAAVAWVTQFMPGWRTTTVANPAPKGTNPAAVPVLEFGRTRAQWKADDEGYVRPYERGVAGHYDFPFRNVSGKDAVVGLEQPSCDCVSIQVCLLPKAEWDKVTQAQAADPGGPAPLAQEPAWHDLKRDPDHGVAVPAEGQGLVRINWNSRKAAGEKLNLTPTLWAQPGGDRPGRLTVRLVVPTFTAPLYFLEPDKVGVGILGPKDVGRAEFDLWSITRPDLDLKVQNPGGEPFYELKTTRLDAAGLKALQERVKDKVTAPIVAGYHLTVTVHEGKDGKEMPLGPFAHALDVLVDEAPGDGTRPTVYGRIRGDVEVGGAEDQSRIDLKSFRTADGTRQVVPVWTEPGAKLEPHDQSPAVLEVKLRKDDKQLRPDKLKWLVEISVPPDSLAGALPEQSAVTLRLVGATPRLVRIPVLGNAISD